MKLIGLVLLMAGFFLALSGVVALGNGIILWGVVLLLVAFVSVVAGWWVYDTAAPRSTF